MTLPSPTLTAASFAVAVVVGLTGMGGGALMTPILVFFFGIPPLTAVGSDLVVSAVTKPFGAVVHLRRGTVNLPIAGWMCIGSVPSAFSGVFLARLLGSGGSVQDIVAFATGVVLIIAAAAIGLKAYSDARRRALAARRPGGPQTEDSESATQDISVRPILTILIGILTGLGVGMTSVGSGSLVIVALTAVYPRLPVRRMVGTDLAQAIPMVFAASAAHLIVGDVRLDVTTALLAGGIPGVVLGSLLSSRAPSSILRPFLAVILLASGLKLVNVPLPGIVWTLTAVLAIVAIAGLIARRRARTATTSPVRTTGTTDRPKITALRRSS